MSDFVSLNHCEYGLESIESQISDFRSKRGCRNDTELLDQISANQLTWMERKEIQKKKKSQSRGWISIYLIPSPAALELKMLLY